MSTPENPNAFPFSAEYGHPGACGGMTLRDYFAGQAVAGMLADPEVGGPTASLAAVAYAYADAMLAERAKVQS